MSRATPSPARDTKKPSAISLAFCTALPRTIGEHPGSVEGYPLVHRLRHTGRVNAVQKIAGFDIGRSAMEYRTEKAPG